MVMYLYTTCVAQNYCDWDGTDTMRNRNQSVKYIEMQEVQRRTDIKTNIFEGGNKTHNERNGFVPLL